MNLYIISLVLRFGSGVFVLLRSIALYTAILLSGVTASTFHDPSTPIAFIFPIESGDAELSLVNLSPEVLAIPESISSLLVGLLVPIPTLPLLAIRITSVGAILVVPLRFAKTIAPCVFQATDVVKNPISAGA